MTGERTASASPPLRKLGALALLLAAGLWSAAAHPAGGEAGLTAVVSAFPPEMAVLRAELEDAASQSVNGVEFVTGRLEGRRVVLFLSGISMVNAAMTVQLALDRFPIDRIVFSGIAGGVDPALDIGDVVVAGRWGQYLEAVFARQVGEGWEKPPFFEYPYANFGMMFPRSVAVARAGAAEPETRFWFPVDERMLARARQAAAGVELERCAGEDECLPRAPKIVIGGSGVSGGAFIDNAAFRDYAFRTFGARVLDMESAAVAHVAWANDVPFIAVRSLSDLAGGSGQANRLEVFFRLAAGNAARVVRALLREMPDG
ncbi:MAG: 5'-methylthioadenosine/S-adenosylhomocysteine nucleosidase [Alphaproteobacteria bacterium]|nr:5'-methylthioadenosine/S-adenosylhomocysteine nucleosidase [Alphaproteobacteria bacterium]